MITKLLGRKRSWQHIYEFQKCDIFFIYELWPDTSADGHQKIEKWNEQALAEGKKDNLLFSKITV